MRLIMAVSEDNFLARGHDDPMDWTHALDKKLFRSLTSVGGAIAAGRTTFELMRDKKLEGRNMYCISRETCVLSGFALRYPDAWLIGGPTVATSAFKEGLLDETHLMFQRGVSLISGIHLDTIDRDLDADPWTKVLETDYGEVRHTVYRRR